MSYFFSDSKDSSGGDGSQVSIFDPSNSTNEGADVSYDSPAKFRVNNNPTTEGVFSGSQAKTSGVNQPRISPITDSPVPWKKSTSNVSDDFKFPTPVPGNELSTSGGLKRRLSVEGSKFQQEHLRQDQTSYQGGEGGHVSGEGEFSRGGQDTKEDFVDLIPFEKRQTSMSQETRNQSHSGEQSSGLDKKPKVDDSDSYQSTQGVLEALLNRQREHLSGILTQVGTAEQNDQNILITIRKVSFDTSAYSIELQRVKEQYQTRLAAVSSLLTKMPGK